MKVVYSSPNRRLSVEADCTTTKQVFELLASLQEVFEETSCKLCKSERIHFDVRVFDSATYYKLTCADCGGQLDLGQSKDNKSLFIKRSKDGKPLANGGWYHYARQQQPQQPAQKPASQPAQKPLPNQEPF
jgi:hypothetical protein